MLCNLPGFEGLYHIYENGEIYSVRKKRILKTYVNNEYYRYQYVCLTGHQGQKLRTGIHRIIALHFHPNPPEGMEIEHLDGNRGNNHYKNLMWVTHQQNMQLAVSRRGAWQGRYPGFLTSDETKRKMSEKKMKRVLIFNSSEEIILKSIDETTLYFNTYRKKIDRYIGTNKELNGFKLRLL